MKKVVVVGAILAISLLLLYLVFITLNVKKVSIRITHPVCFMHGKESEGSPVRGQVDVEVQTSIQPGVPEVCIYDSRSVQ